MSDAHLSPARSETPPRALESLDSSILRVLMDSIPDHIYFKDLNSRFVRNNAAHARSLGAASPEDCVGKTDSDFFTSDHADRAYRDEQEIIRTGRPVISQLERLELRDGRKAWASATKMPWTDSEGRIIGIFGITRDITTAKEAEEKLREERNLLRTIIDHLPSRLYLKDLSYRYVLNNRAHLNMLGAPTQEAALGRTTVDFFPGERGEQAIADDRQALQSGHPILNQEKSDFNANGDVHWSLVTKVPLRGIHDQLIGLVGISHDITRRKKAEQELQQRTTEMETDLKMARQVQEAFLNRAYPVFPRGADRASSALRFAHRYIPTTTLGGDFFVTLQLSDSRCGVLICDVMGHGVRAGLLTARIRGVVEEMDERANDPAHVISEVNQSLMPIVEQTGQPVFATVFYAVIDVAERTLCFANAGHPPPFILHREPTTIERLVGADPEPAAGLLGDFNYTSRRCEFGPGDLFLGYTDGVLGAVNDAGVMYGEERMKSLLNECRGLSGADVSDRLLQSVQAHSGQAVFEDDVCLVAIEASSFSPPTKTGQEEFA